MGRGIEGTKVFRNKIDLEGFLHGVPQWCEEAARFLGVTTSAVAKAANRDVAFDLETGFESVQQQRTANAQNMTR
jgi:hypothetical protein